MIRLYAAAFAALVAGPAFAAETAPAAAPDAVAGKKVFLQNCMICHTDKKGGAASVGPNLFGVVGRKAASAPGYAYSNALKASGLSWSEETLEKWVAGPAKLVPGTKMAFAGLNDHAKVENVVAYLSTLK